MNDFARQILRLVLIIAIDVIIIYSISKTIGKAIARKKEKEELIKSIERYGLNANGYADPEYIKKMIGIKRKYAYLKKKGELNHGNVGDLKRELIQIQIGYSRKDKANDESIKLMNEFRNIKI